MQAEELARTFREAAQRPEVALLLDHGYTGPESPVGGAPDTGGPQAYVRALALSLARLGYRVSVLTRGGFPHFDGTRLRHETEHLGPHVRYVYVPGGGDAFLPREDMGAALDDQVAWLSRWTAAEAEARGVRPWELFAFLNSHFWDGALLGLGLQERWRDDVAAEAIARLLAGVAPDEDLERLRAARHGLALGRDWVHRLGLLLVGLEGSPATPVALRVRAGASRWAAVRGLGPRELTGLLGSVEHALSRQGRHLAPALQPLVAADALGQAVLRQAPELAAWAEAALRRIDRHVWTPHGLATLEEAGAGGRRDPRAAERRSHERAAVAGCRSFAATSAALAGELRARHGVSPERVFYFPPCVDRTRFRPHACEETAGTYRYLAELSGIPVEELQQSRLVFETSRMDPAKRKDLLLEAFARAIEDLGPGSAAYLFVGGGPDNEVAQGLRRQIASRAALRGRAFLTGFIPEQHLAPLFSLAAVYASPSEAEDFGMTVSEAAASGTAVLASDRIPFPRQYAPHDAVILPAGDVDDWVHAFRRILCDDRDRQDRARRLAERVAVLDWDAQTQAFLEHLRRQGLDVPPGSPGPA